MPLNTRNAAALKQQINAEIDEMEMDLATGTSGQTINRPNSPKAPTPEPYPTADKPTTAAKKPDKSNELLERLTVLERRAEIACTICSQVCPAKAVAMVDKLDKETSSFTIKRSITVQGARHIQRVFGSVVALGLGEEAALLYQV